MTKTDSGPPNSVGNEERWDSFIKWGRRFYEADDFDANERAYKLEIGERLENVRNVLLSGSPDWIDLLKRAFGPPNNLTNWRFPGPFLGWCRADPERAIAAFRLLWDPSRLVPARFNDFIASIPADTVRVPITEASFLHMAMDPRDYPIFRATPAAQAMRLTDYSSLHTSGRALVGARYEHYLGFLDRIIDETAHRGLELRDRLDAQSMLWTITSWHPAENWSDEEREAFHAYRGGAPPDEGPGEPASRDVDDMATIPDVSRERLLAVMAEFDRMERETDDWEGWEDDPRHKWAIIEDGRRYPVEHVIAKASGIGTNEFSGGQQANTYVQKRGFAVEPLRSTESPNVWWVNQGSSYVQARDGRYLWAPHVSKTGTTFAHWTNVKKLGANDIVLHYANSALHAVSIVEEPYVDAVNPSVLPGHSEEMGFLTKNRYHEFPEPILLSDIPSTWRESGPGPFTEQGTVKQGYLFPIPDKLLARLVARFPDRWPEGIRSLVPELPEEPRYEQPSYDVIAARVAKHGIHVAERTLRRYHLSLDTRGFVILAGVSGTGKTWLAEAYAESIGARHILVPVAPNWTTNEDLLGFFNPLTGQYHDTPFSRFLREAADAYAEATAAGRTPQPYHLILDEMNLARVEYYFASFLSTMEVRARRGFAQLDLGPKETVTLPPSLFVVGTVNVDETTHGFADKVYDRAQLVELGLQREDISAHMMGRQYHDDLLAIWDAVSGVGPFAFRVLDEIHSYVAAAEALGVSWELALDEQLVQKVLPKLNGAKPGIETSLQQVILTTGERYPLTHKCAERMLEGFHHYGFASYFA